MKDHNSVTNLQKITGNNPNLDLVNMNEHFRFGEILPILSQDIVQKQNSDINRGLNSGTNLQKMMCSNSNLDLVNMIIYILKFGEILSIHSQDIEWKRNSGVNQEP